MSYKITDTLGSVSVTCEADTIEEVMRLREATGLHTAAQDKRYRQNVLVDGAWIPVQADTRAELDAAVKSLLRKEPPTPSQPPESGDMTKGG